MDLNKALGLGFILLTIGLIILYSIMKQKHHGRALRTITAVQKLNESIAMSVEAGTRIHMALGTANILSPNNGSAFAGLSVLERIALVSVLADRMPIATSGNGTFAILAMSTFKRALLQTALDTPLEPHQGRLAGPTAFSYAAGALVMMHREQVSTNLFIGHFGPEIALLTEGSDRLNAIALGASDSLTAQSILLCASETPLIGEELFALPAYQNQSKIHVSSLYAQDILRWGLILIMITGSILKFFGYL